LVETQARTAATGSAPASSCNRANSAATGNPVKVAGSRVSRAISKHKTGNLDNSKDKGKDRVKADSRAKARDRAAKPASEAKARDRAAKPASEAKAKMARAVKEAVDAKAAKTAT
jgi:hypothetical protein